MSFAGDQLPLIGWTAAHLVKTPGGARTHLVLWSPRLGRWEGACGLSVDRLEIVTEPRLPLCRRCEGSTRTTTQREREATR